MPMSKSNFNIMQLNSQEYDSLFSSLLAELDQCAEAQDCDKCELLIKCRAIFDSLADKKCYSRLKPEEFREFEAKFKSLNRQMTLFSQN